MGICGNGWLVARGGRASSAIDVSSSHNKLDLISLISQRGVSGKSYGSSFAQVVMVARCLGTPVFPLF
eukprot:10929760-Lingulodinium_polyedra.AAC.1